MAVFLHRAGNTAAARQRQWRRQIRVQRLVARAERGRAVRVPGRRPVRRNGRSTRVQDETVVAHAEHLGDGGHAVANDADVHGVRVFGDALGGPTPDATGHRTAAQARGRCTRRVEQPAYGAVRLRFGRLPRGAVHRGRLPVVLAQPDQLDVLRVLLVPVYRTGRHAHVRGDRLEHWIPVPRSQQGDREETRGVPEGQQRRRRRHLQSSTALVEIRRKRCCRIHKQL